MMSRVEVTRPPGVLISMSKASAWRFWASVSARPTNSSVIGWIASLMTIFRTSAADATVNDLDVTVRSSRGAPVAADHGEDAWPIVQPDRPFCPLENDRYTLEIAAHRGHGRVAAEVWVLRTARPRSGALPRRDREPPDE